MLRPHKHSNPDKTVIGVTLVVLKALENRHVMGYDELLDHIESRIEGGGRLFLMSLDLLYLLGVLRYHRQNDTFELVRLT